MTDILPRQEHICDKCKSYNPEGDTNYLCAVKGHCPGLEIGPIARKALYDMKFIRDIGRLLGNKRNFPGELIGNLVDTVLNDELLTGRYFFNEDSSIYFIDTKFKKHTDIFFSDITYLKKKD